jgi:hypothetical protein
MGGIVAFLIIFLLFTVVSLQLVNIYYPPTVTIGTPNSVTDVITAPGPAPEVTMEQFNDFLQNAQNTSGPKN